MNLLARITCFFFIGVLLAGATVQSIPISITGIAGIIVGGILFVVADKREERKNKNRNKES